jgi:hypothetical protein
VIALCWSDCARSARLHQIRRAAEVGEELRDRDAGGRPIEDDRVVQAARRNAAAVLRLRAGDAAVRGREERRPRLARGLGARLGGVLAGKDLRVVLQRACLGIVQRQRLGRLRGGRHRDGQNDGRDLCDAAHDRASPATASARRR